MSKLGEVNIFSGALDIPARGAGVIPNELFTRA